MADMMMNRGENTNPVKDTIHHIARPDWIMIIKKRYGMYIL